MLNLKSQKFTTTKGREAFKRQMLVEDWRTRYLEHDDTVILYKGWNIFHSPKPIPTRQHDWEAVHQDYDGPEDGRCLTGKSAKDMAEQIDEWPGE